MRMNDLVQGQAVAEGGAGGALAASPAGVPSRSRARVLGILSIVFGVVAFVAVPAPLPSSFPWLTLGLSFVGMVVAVLALRARPRGRLAVTLALAGLLVSLAFPVLVVFVFVRYFNWS
jgi:hypothetical protein